MDVLTLSATPIPRTLYLALTGARDMSTIQTPPHDRLPVETIAAPYDERLIRDAIQRELNRGVEQRLTGDIDFGAEEHSQTQHQVLDPPPHGPHRSAKGPLQIHEDQNRAQQTNQIQRFARPAHNERPTGSRCRSNYGDHLVAEAQRDADRYDKSANPRCPPPVQELPIIPPGVTQTENQPESWKKRRGQQLQPLPMDYFLRRTCSNTQRVQRRFRPQCQHATDERPLRPGKRP